LFRWFERYIDLSALIPEGMIRGMEINFLTLEFRSELEDRFREAYYRSSLGLLRASFLLGAVYYLVFLLLDWMTMQEHFSTLLFLRLGLVVPVILIVFLLSFTEGFQSWWQLAAGFTTVISGLGIVVMTVISDPLIRTAYYPGLILILIYCYMLIRLRFIWASLTGWILVGVYSLSLIIFPGPDRNIVEINLFFLISANLLGMFGGYTLEFFTRLNFYHQNLLAEERKKVQNMNLHLEDRVEEKTQELERNVKDLRALQRIDKAISSSMELNVSLRIFLQAVIDRLKVDAAVVYLYDQENHELTFAGGRGFKVDPVRRDSPTFGRGLIGRVVGSHSKVYEKVSEQDGTSALADWGGESFQSFYGLPLKVKGELIGVLGIFQKSGLALDDRWVDLAETLARQAAIAVDSVIRFNRLQQENLELTIRQEQIYSSWVRALEVSGVEATGQIDRLTRTCALLGQSQQITRDQIEWLRRGAQLHDLGMLGVPRGILEKPGPLTEAEMEQVRNHPLVGVDLLKDIAYLEPVLSMVRSHHERWDGSGYPDGLEGKEIPLSARILGLVDVWGALSIDRPYRDAWSNERIREYLEEQAGVLFDPVLVSAFLQMI
jgi:HD-GYP domain-containing protein (c-di-GMP phosphodiesterase class II)